MNIQPKEIMPNYKLKQLQKFILSVITEKDSLIFANGMGVKRYLTVVLIYISLITNNVDHQLSI